MSAFTRPLPCCVSPPFRVLSIAVVAWGDENAVPGLMPEMPNEKSRTEIEDGTPIDLRRQILAAARDH